MGDTINLEVRDNDLKKYFIKGDAYLNKSRFSQVEINIASLFLGICILLIWSRLQIINADAASMSGISDIFNSRTFIGDTKWLEKMNWLGKVVNMGITIGGSFAAIIIACQIMLTIIYFGMPKLWDSVNQAKVADQKKGLWNYTASLFAGGKSGMTGNLSRGSDIFMDFLVLMLPNVKKYSENAEDDYENFTTWIMSTALRKCLVMLAISMMINGSLLQCYMVVVDGLGVFADRFVQFDGKAAVNKLLSNGDNYNFSLGSAGVGIDVVQGKVAESIYREIIKTSTVSDTDFKFSVGQSIENYVRSNVTKDAVQDILVGAGAGGDIKDADWSRVRIQTVLNGTSGGSNSINISASDLGLQDAGKPRYFHIYFTLNSKGDTTYYFGPVDGND